MSIKQTERIKSLPQLLKWVGNKQRYAKNIVYFMPDSIDTYIEPFLGIGPVLGTVLKSNIASRTIGGDILKTLMEFWFLVQNNPKELTDYYENNWKKYQNNPTEVYQLVRDGYNSNPNPLDLLFISRTCYGGVMRFTREGKISTPIGPHKPIKPFTFSSRLYEWYRSVKNTKFYYQSFEKTMKKAKEGDVVYCDPPYLYSQSILYGSQNFEFEELLNSIKECKEEGAKVLLSIDGRKKSGKEELKIALPGGLFEREIIIDCGKSMLRRFQRKGKILIGEDVHDRLLLTW